MGKADRYLKGDWNVICDYCGEKRKQSQCRLTWDNYLVCSDTCWEPRQPQDFVRGKVDKQRVPPYLARPDDVQDFTETTTDGAVVRGAETVTLDTAVAKYTTIGIAMDDTDVIHWTYVVSLSTKTVTLGEAMPGPAADETTVIIAHDGRFLDTTEVSIDDY